MYPTTNVNSGVEIQQTKALRVELDSIIKAVKFLSSTRETSLVVTKLQEARMWAGQNLSNYESEYDKSQFADKSDSPKEL
jgi:hypothetical protein